MSDWSHFLSAMTLALVRLSAVVAFAPFFSSTALPPRTKAVFVLVTAYLLAPRVASMPHASTQISFASLIGEVAVGIVYGLTLAFFNEILLFAGQIAGMQVSFSLVNLLDPASSIQTPLLGELFQLFGTLIVLSAGLDRVVLLSIIRSFHAVPLGTYAMAPVTTLAIVEAANGIFLAALELAAPLLAATMVAEITVSLLGKLSPQLPVTALTIPLKTLTGFVLLMGALALWPRFMEARFDQLLDLGERTIATGLKGSP